MDRVVGPLTVAASRSAQYEGRARRLTASNTPKTDFRSLVSTEPARTDPVKTDPAKTEPQVSGWAGLVTAGKTGPAGSTAQAAAAPAAPADPVPTLEGVFGESPWMAAPAGQGPLGVYYYNPLYFATAQTAEKVAQMLGGTVIQQNAFCSAGGPFQQLQPNYMVRLPNGRVTNPGLVAAYYSRGYPQSFIDRLLSIERNETA